MPGAAPVNPAASLNRAHDLLTRKPTTDQQKVAAILAVRDLAIIGTDVALFFSHVAGFAFSGSARELQLAALEVLADILGDSVQREKVDWWDTLESPAFWVTCADADVNIAGAPLRMLSCLEPADFTSLLHRVKSNESGDMDGGGAFTGGLESRISAITAQPLGARLLGCTLVRAWPSIIRMYQGTLRELCGDVLRQILQHLVNSDTSRADLRHAAASVLDRLLAEYIGIQPAAMAVVALFHSAWPFNRAYAQLLSFLMSTLRDALPSLCRTADRSGEISDLGGGVWLPSTEHVDQPAPASDNNALAQMESCAWRAGLVWMILQNHKLLSQRLEEGSEETSPIAHLGEVVFRIVRHESVHPAGSRQHSTATAAEVLGWTELETAVQRAREGSSGAQHWQGRFAQGRAWLLTVLLAIAKGDVRAPEVLLEATEALARIGKGVLPAWGSQGLLVQRLCAEGIGSIVSLWERLSHILRRDLPQAASLKRLVSACAQVLAISTSVLVVKSSRDQTRFLWLLGLSVRTLLKVFVDLNQANWTPQTSGGSNSSGASGSQLHLRSVIYEAHGAAEPGASLDPAPVIIILLCKECLALRPVESERHTAGQQKLSPNTWLSLVNEVWSVCWPQILDLNVPKLLSQWKVGDAAWRRGEPCVLVKIDVSMDPPSGSVRISAANGAIAQEREVGVELHSLKWHPFQNTPQSEAAIWWCLCLAQLSCRFVTTRSTEVPAIVRPLISGIANVFGKDQRLNSETPELIVMFGSFLDDVGGLEQLGSSERLRLIGIIEAFSLRTTSEVVRHIEKLVQRMKANSRIPHESLCSLLPKSSQTPMWLHALRSVEAHCQEEVAMSMPISGPPLMGIVTMSSRQEKSTDDSTSVVVSFQIDLHNVSGITLRNVSVSLGVSEANSAASIDQATGVGVWTFAEGDSRPALVAFESIPGKRTAVGFHHLTLHRLRPVLISFLIAFNSNEAVDARGQAQDGENQASRNKGPASEDWSDDEDGAEAALVRLSTHPLAVPLSAYFWPFHGFDIPVGDVFPPVVVFAACPHSHTAHFQTWDVDAHTWCPIGFHCIQQGASNSDGVESAIRCFSGLSYDDQMLCFLVHVSDGSSHTWKLETRASSEALLRAIVDDLRFWVMASCRETFPVKN